MINPGVTETNLIDQLPYICFKRDPDSRFSYVSRQILNWGMFKSLDEIIGKSDFEMPWSNDAEKYIEEDQLSLKGNSQFLLHSLPRQDGTKLLHFCHKTPLYNEKNKIIGIGGIGFEMTLENYKNIFSILAFAGLNISDFNKIVHPKKLEFIYKNICFTKRQAQILCFLLRGYSAELTAKELKLSKRTIEFYLTRLRDKLECNNKHDLVKKAFELGYIDSMFMRF